MRGVRPSGASVFATSCSFVLVSAASLRTLASVTGSPSNSSAIFAHTVSRELRSSWASLRRNSAAR